MTSALAFLRKFILIAFRSSTTDTISWRFCDTLQIDSINYFIDFKFTGEIDNYINIMRRQTSLINFMRDLPRPICRFSETGAAFPRIGCY